MKVRIVCRTNQLHWILGKIARRLVDELQSVVQVSLGPVPDRSADINHYVWYDDYDGKNDRTTIGITHVDSVRKFERISKQLNTAGAAICLSKAHMQDLVHAGLPRDKLFYVNPAHDAVITSKKFRIGITTRLYTPDPCKREWMLQDLAEHIDPSDFCFCIMGSGWHKIVKYLQARAFDVTYYPQFNLSRYRMVVPTFDFYLYLGWDEGSMGLLDALHAGVKTIATPQGFHLDIVGGLSHSFEDIDSLILVFQEIVRAKHARTASVGKLTWPNYAAEHLNIWSLLLSGRKKEWLRLNRPLPKCVTDRGSKVDPAKGKSFLTQLEAIDRTRARAHAQYGMFEATNKSGQPSVQSSGVPLASVIVPTRNRGRSLHTCLDSLVEQTIDGNEFEIIVVDNGSHDDTAQRTEQFIKDHQDHMVRYVKEPVPGLLAARHRGAAESEADIICYIDDDVVTDPQWLSSVLQAFDDPTVHLVGGPSTARYESQPPYWIEDFFLEIPEGRCLDYLSLIDLGPMVKEIPPYYVWGLNYSIRKSTLFELAGFHPDAVPEDNLKFRGDGEGGLSQKLLDRGYKCVYHPAARVEHLIGPERLELDYFQNRSFRQGISDSYSQIRKSGTAEGIPRQILPDTFQPTTEDAKEFHIRMLRYETKRAYARGYNFHLDAVRSDRSLLAWVLKPDYIEDYDFRH